MISRLGQKRLLQQPSFIDGKILGFAHHDRSLDDVWVWGMFPGQGYDSSNRSSLLSTVVIL